MADEKRISAHDDALNSEYGDTVQSTQISMTLQHDLLVNPYHKISV